MPMKNPVHPGRIVRHDCLEPFGLSVTAGLAIRLSKAFGRTPETWLRMQAAFDLAVAMKCEKDIRVERYGRGGVLG